MPVATLEAVLIKARRYCAYQERSQQELRDKLYTWGLNRKDVEQVIALMITEGFLNEERFAVAYAGGKFRMKSWGKVKIRAGLRRKKVSEYCIRLALGSISENLYRQRLKKVIDAYASKNRLANAPMEKQRLARYAISKGYESALVWEVLSEE